MCEAHRNIVWNSLPPAFIPSDMQLLFGLHVEPNGGLSAVLVVVGLPGLWALFRWPAPDAQATTEAASAFCRPKCWRRSSCMYNNRFEVAWHASLPVRLEHRSVPEHVKRAQQASTLRNSLTSETEVLLSRAVHSCCFGTQHLQLCFLLCVLVLGAAHLGLMPSNAQLYSLLSSK